VLVLSAVTALAVLASFSLFSSPVAAGSADLTVYGWVTDSNGDPVEGADILIEVLAGTNPQLTTTTDSDGFYQVDFDMADWQIGDTVRTTATYGAAPPESNTGVADATTMLNIDVQFTTEIPEFGSLTGVLVTMVIIGVVATVSMRRKKA
jgi:hypothetical protein